MEPMSHQEYSALVADLRGPHADVWNDEDIKCKDDPERKVTRTTLCQVKKFDTIFRHFNNINKLNGDIVECGIWQGGMSIFLAKLFQGKNIWMCDSFKGFQPLDIATYPDKAFVKGILEAHTPSYQAKYLDSQGIPYNISAHYDSVIRNLARFDLQPDDRIKLLKGWVKDTLHPDRCDIKNIALLRIDVDAYSATLEVLEHLYDKVVPGGFVIFDDCCLIEAREAMCDFFERRGVENYLRHITTDAAISSPRQINPCGCYMVKL